MIRLRRVARNLQWRGCGFGGPKAEHPALKNFVFSFAKKLNFRPILIKINASEMWHRN